MIRKMCVSRTLKMNKFLCVEYTPTKIKEAYRKTFIGRLMKCHQFVSVNIFDKNNFVIVSNKLMWKVI